MAVLVISLPGGNAETYELSAGKITLGRSPDNDIQIRDASVSNHHAEFTLLGDTYQLTDLRSQNGTCVFWEPIGQVELKPGTPIRFGNVDAVYSPLSRAAAQPVSELEPISEISATDSRHTADLTNAFPFEPKFRRRDKVGAAIIGFAIFSIIVFLGAITMMLLVEVPQ